MLIVALVEPGTQHPLQAPDRPCVLQVHIIVVTTLGSINATPKLQQANREAYPVGNMQKSRHIHEEEHANQHRPNDAKEDCLVHLLGRGPERIQDKVKNEEVVHR